MKLLLPLLVASAAVSHAQTAQVKVDNKGDYAVSLDKYEVVRDGDDFDGLAFGAKASLAKNWSATFSWASASSDAFVLNGTNLELEATRFALGAEYDLSAGPGGVTLSLAYSQTSTESEIGSYGDAFDNNQLVVGARYEQALGAGFSATIGVTHFINDFEGKGVRATDLDARYGDSTTSFGVTLAYQVVRNVSVHLTYSTEDALLGLSDADNTISFGVRANF